MGDEVAGRISGYAVYLANHDARAALTLCDDTS